MIVPNSADTCETNCQSQCRHLPNPGRGCKKRKRTKSRGYSDLNGFTVTQNFVLVKEKMRGISEALVITFTRDPDVINGVGMKIASAGAILLFYSDVIF